MKNITKIALGFGVTSIAGLSIFASINKTEKACTGGI